MVLRFHGNLRILVCRGVVSMVLARQTYVIQSFRRLTGLRTQRIDDAKKCNSVTLFVSRLRL